MVKCSRQQFAALVQKKIKMFILNCCVKKYIFSLCYKESSTISPGSMAEALEDRTLYNRQGNIIKTSIYADDTLIHISNLRLRQDFKIIFRSSFSIAMKY